MQCPKCRRPLREDLAECPGCGADLTYWVADAAGKRYGPYPLAEVRRYVAEGRIAPTSQVSQGGGPWQPLAAALGTGPGAAPSSAARTKRGMSPVAIVLLVVGGVMLLGIIGMAALVGTSFSKARTQATSATCRSHLKQIALGMIMFSVDYNGPAPDAATWQTDIQPYVKNTELCRCPSGGDYEMNPALSRTNLMQLPNSPTTPLIYDAGFPNGTPPHADGWNVAFADGHCKTVSQAEAGQYQLP